MLYLTSLKSYALFHSLAEIFSIVIACGIFMIAWNSRNFLDSDYLLFIGCAYFFVALIDLFHTLAFKGMGVFPGNDANPATQLWIAARYMESISLLLAPLFLTRRLKSGLMLLVYAGVTSLLLLSIFYWPLFPVCYIEGQGLTPFKKISEYAISLILTAVLVILAKYRDFFDEKILRLVAWSTAATILSELAFVFYVGVYDFSNLVGHYFKIISFYLIYEAIIAKGLTQPYNLFFRNLKVSEAELMKRTAQLEEVNRDLESFSYSVSHDLKAPLRAINSFSQMLGRGRGGDLNEEGQRLLNIIIANARKMGTLIDDILAFSRAGRGEIELSEIDMEALSRSVIDEIKAANPGRQLRFEINSLPPAIGDPPTIRQVYANLLNNAVKFTQPKESALITLDGATAGNENIYSVKDNGVGFDTSDADSLFGVFRRLHPAAEFEGSGIGLATVKRFIDKLGGRVWAEGRVNEGATFYFSLPGSGQAADEGS